jgi:hypothetical protein
MTIGMDLALSLLSPSQPQIRTIHSKCHAQLSQRINDKEQQKHVISAAKRKSDVVALRLVLNA